jgi:ligand-binding sensor domain-containing protein
LSFGTSLKASLRRGRARLNLSPTSASFKVTFHIARPVILICLFSTLILSPVVFSQASPRHNPPYLHRTWTSEDGLPQNSVTAIVQGKDDYLWLGTFGGLARFDGVDVKIFNQSNTPELRSSRIMTLYEDRAGNLWVETNHGGLVRYWNGTFTTFTVGEGLPDDTLLSIAKDRDGGLWIGTTHGLARFDAGKITSCATKPGMPGGPVSAIWQDKRGAPVARYA